MSLTGNLLFIFPTPESWNFENSHLFSAWAIVAVSNATHNFFNVFRPGAGGHNPDGAGGRQIRALLHFCRALFSFPLLMTYPARFRRPYQTLSAGALWMLLFASGCGRPASSPAARDYLVYVGTNVAGEQDSTIFLYRLSPATGVLTRVSAQRGGASPTYLTLSASRRFLYAVSETQTFRGVRSGGVSTFAVAPRTGPLRCSASSPRAAGRPATSASTTPARPPWWPTTWAAA